MAGTGPAPAEVRRRRNEPARGDWVDLDPLEKPVLPVLPKRAKGTGSWSGRTRSAWARWRNDPATAEYASADIAFAIDLAYLYEEWVRGSDEAGEVRQRMDRLGLNPKGKRDLRYRIRSGDDASPTTPTPKKRGDRRARLTVVK